MGLAIIRALLTNICNKAKATVIKEDLFIYLHMQNASTMRITNIKTVNTVQKKRQLCSVYLNCGVIIHKYVILCAVCFYVYKNNKPWNFGSHTQ